MPLIPLDKVADYIQCDRCGCTFKPEVLTWGSAAQPGTPPPLPGSVPPASPQPVHAGHSGPGFHDSPASTVTYRANGLAKLSMILGILGVLTSFLFCPSVFLCLAGLILGLAGLSRVKREPHLYAGKNQALTGIVCSSVGLAVILVLGFFVFKDGDPNPKSPSQSQREAANMSISSSSSQTAFGNTPKATELAKKYSTAMSGMHLAFFKSSKGTAPKKANYVVHCELRDGSCAFLASVPQYRKFTGDAKASLELMAWSMAQAVLEEEAAGNTDLELCVALKGVVLYGAVMIGPLASDKPVSKSKDEDDMDRFFPEIVEMEPVAEEKE